MECLDNKMNILNGKYSKDSGVSGCQESVDEDLTSRVISEGCERLPCEWYDQKYTSERVEPSRGVDMRNNIAIQTHDDYDNQQSVQEFRQTDFNCRKSSSSDIVVDDEQVDDIIVHDEQVDDIVVDDDNEIETVVKNQSDNAGFPTDDEIVSASAGRPVPGSLQSSPVKFSSLYHIDFNLFMESQKLHRQLMRGPHTPTKEMVESPRKNLIKDPSPPKDINYISPAVLDAVAQKEWEQSSSFNQTTGDTTDTGEMVVFTDSSELAASIENEVVTDSVFVDSQKEESRIASHCDDVLNYSQKTVQFTDEPSIDIINISNQNKTNPGNDGCVQQNVTNETVWDPNLEHPLLASDHQREYH